MARGGEAVTRQLGSQDHLLQTVECIMKANKKAKTPTELKMHDIRTLLIAYSEGLEKTENTAPPKDFFSELERCSHLLAEEVFHDPKTGMNTIHYKEPHSYYVSHPVNSAIFSALIGFSVGYSLEDLKVLTYAALIHDVGNIFIPKAILYKKEDLNPEEWKIIESHTIQGAELLQSVGSPDLVTKIAHQHHERIDGSGYPQNLRGNQIHHYSKIVAIADVFDAIISNRPYAGGRNAEEAIKRMRAKQGLFDSNFLYTLFKSLKGKQS